MFSDKVIALDASFALNTTKTVSSVLSILRSEIRPAKSLAVMIKLILASLRTVLSRYNFNVDTFLYTYS